MFDFSGKCALVTGAAGGIGRAIARQLHGQGATLALTDMKRAGMEELAKELGGRVHIIEANLTDPEAAGTLISEAEKAMGRIDILVNNAGLTRDNLGMRMKDDEWQAGPRRQSDRGVPAGPGVPAADDEAARGADHRHRVHRRRHRQCRPGQLRGVQGAG